MTALAFRYEHGAVFVAIGVPFMIDVRSGVVSSMDRHRSSVVSIVIGGTTLLLGVV